MKKWKRLRMNTGSRYLLSSVEKMLTIVMKLIDRQVT